MNILITGGAGFIGTNVAEFYARQGCRVWIFDNLSRLGSSLNLDYLQTRYPSIQHIQGDVRNYTDVEKAFTRSYDVVFHFAGQVAVTTSVVNPREDFKINALGAFNVLESMRIHRSTAVLLYASTNKVYGGLEHLAVVETDGVYAYRDFPDGISEKHPLDFHSPYGCSKGAADQYVRDYSRIFGLKTIVFRQSCIYGYRQFGIEDQGWVAWFTLAAVTGMPVTIYGDGKQVRDVLFIEDLVRAYDCALLNIQSTAGQIYNIGGGRFRLSILRLLEMLEKKVGPPIKCLKENWRPGDQKVFISDTRLAETSFDWRPQISVEEGLDRLVKWVAANQELFKQIGLVS